MEPSRASQLDLRPRTRFSGSTLGALAALIGLLAIVLGAWAFATAAGEEGTAVTVTSAAADPRLVSLLAEPETDRIPLKGSVGRLVLAVDRKDSAMLVVDGLGAAPAGRSYQAWLIRPGSRRPVSVALFDAKRMLVPLAARIRPGATVAVTLERVDGAPAPTRTPRLLAVRR